ncbi:MAG TPA: NTP transferase domain-containing protein [Xanthomonadaceae bacterium]|jgi:molybdopterin-guanine dinucleotide biosynthesis protein A|nr:NTP transferase domain-containing protein [Xanthomonadaceae bacterium]
MEPDRARRYQSTTLGILAGGRATRLGSSDKAWAIYRGETLIERILQALGDAFAARCVSANRDIGRYVCLGLPAVADRVAGFPGPLAGLDALLTTCATALLMTVPVDLQTVPADLVQRLHAAGEGGAVAQDANGLQPLVALWPVARARIVVADALARGEHAAHRIVATLALPVVRFDGADFGNLNTPDDFLT